MNTLNEIAKRHGVAIAMLIVTLLLIGASKDVTLGTSYSCAALELIAMWVCYLVLYVFTPVNFIKYIIQFFNGEERDVQKLYASIAIVCAVIISVHVLFAGCVFGIYFTNFKPIP